jgi:hypothetical protein
MHVLATSAVLSDFKQTNYSNKLISRTGWSLTRIPLIERVFRNTTNGWAWAASACDISVEAEK